MMLGIGRALSLTLTLLLFSVDLRCYGALVKRDRVDSSDVIELSADAQNLKSLLSENDEVEVYDKDTLLLHRPDAVYQVHIPQQAVEASEVTVNTESPRSIIKSLETSGYEQITLARFTQLTGVKENAGLVFRDWDVNGDGVLDRDEILQEDSKMT